MTNGQIKTRRKTKTNQFKTDSLIPDHQNPIEILYKLKDEIDLIYRLVRLQANILGQIDERRLDRIDHDDVDDNRHIYRVWRTKLSKLKPKQCGKRSYDYLFDLYRYLLKATDVDNGCVCSSSSITSKSTNNIDNCHPMLITKRSTRTRIKEKPGDVIVETTLPRAGGRRKLFKCTVENCKYVCKQIRSFRSHQKVHAYGTEGLYSCRLCSKKFIRQASLNHHLKLVHTDSDGVYPCNVNQCQESFANWELVRKHKIEVHEQRKVHQCDQCPRVYKTRSSLMSHQKGHDSLICSVEGCSKIFATKLMLQSHIRNEHQPPKYKCDKCSQTFRLKAQFDRHQKVLNCTWMYRCHVPNCTEQYKQLKQLAQHTKTEHQCEPCFPCSWTDCAYRSHSLHLLNNHYRTHTGERPYPCGWPGCDWRFKTMWLLRTHRKIHLDERSYHCYWPDCSHRSNTAPSFRRHIMVHEKNERKRLLKLQLLNEIEEEQESNKTIITDSNAKVESEECVTITKAAETINNNH